MTADDRIIFPWERPIERAAAPDQPAALRELQDQVDERGRQINEWVKRASLAEATSDDRFRRWLDGTTPCDPGYIHDYAVPEAKKEGKMSGQRQPWLEHAHGPCAACERREAEFDKLRRDANESNRILGDECASAEAERDAAIKDAERYRFLRNFKCTSDYYADVDRWSVSRERKGYGECYTGANLDAHIDAAIARAVEK